MTYEYRCRGCGATQDMPTRFPHGFDSWCFRCGTETHWGRRYSVSMKPVMQEHFNHTTMQPVSDHKQFADQLKVASEQAYRDSGIEHDFRPNTDMSPADLGVSTDGIYESNVNRSRRGEPLLPEIDAV